MKLYTEEQVIAGFTVFGGINEDTTRKVVELITPIELPSDEEIDKKFGERITMYDLGYTDGIKYLRDKMKGNK